MWSTYAGYALQPFIALLVLVVLVTMARRARGRPPIDPWAVGHAVAVVYAPHVLLVVAGCLLASAGLDLHFLPHHAGSLAGGEGLVRLIISIAPTAALLPIAWRALDDEVEPATEPAAKPLLAPRQAHVALGLVLLAGLLIAGSTAISEHEAVAPVGSGDVVAPFSLQSRAGGSLSSSELAGQVTLIDFWATWCTPCIATMPLLERLHRELSPRGLRLLSVNVQAREAPGIDAFIAKHGVTFPVYHDSGPLQAALRVQSLPTAVLLDDRGAVRQVYVGITPYERMRRDVERLLTP